jgi:hypothetical protein
MGRWRKLGLLFCPDGDSHPKLSTHAANPLPVHMGGDLYRVFYSGRDRENRSSVGAVDINLIDRDVVKVHREPFFEHGSPDSFFEAGVSIGCCYRVMNITYMLFMGWQNRSGSHWRGDIGRLIVTDAFGLRLDRDVPLLAASDEDPISLSYPWVRASDTGGWIMWYGSTVAWDAGNGEMLHVIKSATSLDGHSWTRRGVSVPHSLGLAQAFSRPTITKLGGSLSMWFSYRSGSGETYRIGRADSSDGQAWRLALANSGIDVSPSGWDSEMIEYPFIWNHGSDLYMIYNGNGFGRTGFGLAVWED